MDKSLRRLNKIIFMILFFYFSIIANANEKVKKTSELELFLFKIGFESLLKDVKINKKDTSYNKEQLELINQKVNLIMEDIYKNNLNLNIEDKISNENEMKLLREQVFQMSKQINFLEKKLNSYDKLNENNFKKQHVIKKEVLIKKQIKTNKHFLKAVVNKDGMFVKNRPTFEGSKTIDNYILGKEITLEFCNKFGWCKLLNEDKYVVEYLLRFTKL